ncbi:MAG: sulfatase [Planctomycetes bacterium]|nr:sulfatase [Planctomycetota bacterium]
MRRSLALLFLALAASPASTQQSDGRAAASPVRRPNVVLILADDLGWRDLHVQGHAKLDTPVLDQLARDGMRFTSAYAASPVCTPTRAALMTGLTPARLSITNHAPGNGPGFVHPTRRMIEAENQTYLPLERITLAERLKGAGYRTGFFGKWHLSACRETLGLRETELRPEHQGFERNVGGWDRGGPATYFAPYRNPTLVAKSPGEHLEERLAAEAIEFVDAAGDEPFFLCWWTYSVHYPLEAPSELIAKYEQRRGEDLAEPIYGAMIEALDRAIGRLIAALDARGLRENTLFVFTSDNGSYNGDNRPLRGAKGHLYEGGIRVPQIVRWPSVVRAASLCNEPVTTVDLHETILEACGVATEAERVRDGQSLLPLLRGEESFERAALYFHYPNYAFHKQNRLGSAIRRGRHKLLRFYDDGALELYDLESDPSETKNLAAVEPELCTAMERDLQRWLAETGAKLPTRAPR